MYIGPTIDNTNNGAIIPNETGKTDQITFQFRNGDNRNTGFPTTGNDGDGAVATANYYMALHQPWEWTASKKPADGFWREVALSVAQPGYAGNNSGIACTWNEDNPFVADAALNANDIVAGAFTVAGAATPYPGLNALLTLVGFTVDKFGPKPDNGTGDFDGAWGDGHSTFSTPYPSNYWTMTPQQQNNVRQNYTMVPHLFLHYTTNYYLGDNWGSSGYIGQVPKAFATLDMRADGKGPGAMDWCGAFQLNNDPNKPPKTYSLKHFRSVHQRLALFKSQPVAAKGNQQCIDTIS